MRKSRLDNLFAGLFLIISLISLWWTIWIIGGCGSAAGCGIAGLYFIISFLAFVLSALLSFLFFQADKRWAILALAILSLLAAVISAYILGRILLSRIFSPLNYIRQAHYIGRTFIVLLVSSYISLSLFHRRSEM